MLTFASPWTRPGLRRVVVTVLATLVVAVPTGGYAQVARTEVHPFPSMTLTDQEFLNGREDGKPITLAGELRFPRLGADRLPVVILLHGSGGISGYVTDWAQDLNALGVATFVIDSFTARGITSTNDDQAQLGRLTMIEDAYRALDVLAKHPRLDPAHIALMGFSRGGQAALYASVMRFQRLHGPAGQEFAGYLAFYPPCDTVYRDDEELANRPIRLFHGEADDYVPVAPCRAYVQRLQARGKDVQLTVYPGAGHVFDGQAYRKPLTLPKAQTTRHCALAEAAGGVIINAKTQQPFTYADPCVEYGPTIAYNEPASLQARKAVGEFVAASLKRP